MLKYKQPKYINKMRKFGLLTLIVLCASNVFAQEVVGSAGNSHQVGDMTISWTLGEMVIESFFLDDLILTQGMHQPVLIVTSVEDCIACSYEFALYPNPAAEYVLLEFNNAEVAAFNYRLINASGHILDFGNIDQSLQRINLSDYKNGYYILSIYEKNKLVKTFNIIKK